ncbi:hypothetical protein [Flaviaesturariibacter terrae]
MISEAQLERLFPSQGKSLFSYLSYKHRGGTNNSKGNTFENHFTVFKIAEHFNQGSSWDQTFFTGQEFVFIDDLVVEQADNDHIEHYQIKDVQSLTWTGGDHPIEEDFKIQHHICQDLGKTTTLELVVSNDSVKNGLQSSMSATLSAIASVRHFEKAISIQTLLAANSDVRRELAAMCALNNPATDKLVTLGTLLLGAWSSSGQKRVSLQELINQCHSSNPNYIKGLTNQVPAPLAAILDRIAGFTYDVQGGYIVWKFGPSDEGTINYQIGTTSFLQWENDVVNEKPSDFETLEPYLSK